MQGLCMTVPSGGSLGSRSQAQPGAVAQASGLWWEQKVEKTAGSGLSFWGRGVGGACPPFPRPVALPDERWAVWHAPHSVPGYTPLLSLFQDAELLRVESKQGSAPASFCHLFLPGLGTPCSASPISWSIYQSSLVTFPNFHFKWKMRTALFPQKEPPSHVNSDFYE